MTPSLLLILSLYRVCGGQSEKQKGKREFILFLALCPCDEFWNVNALILTIKLYMKFDIPNNPWEKYKQNFFIKPKTGSKIFYEYVQKEFCNASQNRSLQS